MIESVGYTEPFVKETSIAAEKQPGRAVFREDQADTSPDDGVKALEDAEKSGQSQEEETKQFGQEELSQEEKHEVTRLQRTDSKVRAHESAHVNAGAGLIRGGPYYDFETGPDGKRYAVGGRVEIDHEPEDDPETTIRKMKRVKNAALAAGEPSTEDRQVAAKAQRHEAEAQVELIQKERENIARLSADDTEQSASEAARPYGPPKPVAGAFHATV